MSHPERIQLIEYALDGGINHLFMADHVSFHGGAGKDGLIEVAALSQLHPDLELMVSIYLLPLRHPMIVARQLATLHEIAPGRVTFGVGIGGEDRHEIEVCGVDPATRGRRMNESMDILRKLMTGNAIDYDGEFFQLDNARIKPAISAPIPMIVGGRSNAALTRTARYGDGWIGTWCSVRRFVEAVDLIRETAAGFGRRGVNWQHGYQPWVGIGESKQEARDRVAKAMEAFYKVPFGQFEKYVPYGTPQEVAAELKPFVDAGCRIMNIKAVAGNDGEEVSAVREISQVLCPA
jgi:alkanesulfonate monooxygenase SsuD/methylene tetrahydromethanopterin reductase-like flavin-dependent oxidoreductase (luciferase family)